MLPAISELSPGDVLITGRFEIKIRYGRFGDAAQTDSAVIFPDAGDHVELFHISLEIVDALATEVECHDSLDLSTGKAQCLWDSGCQFAQQYRCLLQSDELFRHW